MIRFTRYLVTIAFLLAPLSAAALDARPLTMADLAEIGGSDFNGGVGDILLRNDKVWAVILNVGATPDFGIPWFKTYNLTKHQTDDLPVLRNPLRMERR